MRLYRVIGLLLTIIATSVGAVGVVYADDYGSNYDDPSAPSASEDPRSVPEVDYSRPVTAYVPMEGKWVNTYQGEVERFNPMANKWQMARPDANLRFNPMTNQWSYPR